MKKIVTLLYKIARSLNTGVFIPIKETPHLSKYISSYINLRKVFFDINNEAYIKGDFLHKIVLDFYKQKSPLVSLSRAASIQNTIEIGIGLPQFYLEDDKIKINDEDKEKFWKASEIGKGLWVSFPRSGIIRTNQDLKHFEDKIRESIRDQITEVFTPFIEGDVGARKIFFDVQKALKNIPDISYEELMDHLFDFSDLTDEFVQEHGYDSLDDFRDYIFKQFSEGFRIIQNSLPYIHVLLDNSLNPAYWYFKGDIINSNLQAGETIREWIYQKLHPHKKYKRRG